MCCQFFIYLAVMEVDDVQHSGLRNEMWVYVSNKSSVCKMLTVLKAADICWYLLGTDGHFGANKNGVTADMLKTCYVLKHTVNLA